jgi:hypothetical protein
VVVAGEVSELVREDGAELVPVPVLERVERDIALGVVRRVAEVLERVDPRRERVLVDRELAPADVDVALARVHAPVLIGDGPGRLERGPFDRPALSGRRRGVCG